MSNAPIHIVPIDDLIEHETNGEPCPCGAKEESVFREDGSNGWLVLHHSLDGRELRERGERIPREA